MESTIILKLLGFVILALIIAIVIVSIIWVAPRVPRYQKFAVDMVKDVTGAVALLQENVDIIMDGVLEAAFLLFNPITFKKDVKILQILGGSLTKCYDYTRTGCGASLPCLETSCGGC